MINSKEKQYTNPFETRIDRARGKLDYCVGVLSAILDSENDFDVEDIDTFFQDIGGAYQSLQSAVKLLQFNRANMLLEQFNHKDMLLEQMKNEH